MKSFFPRLAGSLLVVSLLVTLGGCASNRLQEERDRLVTENTDLRKQIDSQQQALDAANRERAQFESDNAALKAGQQTAVAPPHAGGPAVVAHPPGHTGFSDIPGVETDQSVAGRVTVRIPGDVLFAPGKDDFKDSYEKSLSQIAAVIKKEYPSNKIRVEGYTDSDPIRKSKWKDNMELSQARAETVADYLKEEGIPGSRVTAVGMGDAKPRKTKAESRRVEIVVQVAEK